MSHPIPTFETIDEIAEFDVITRESDYTHEFGNIDSYREECVCQKGYSFAGVVSGLRAPVRHEDTCSMFEDYSSTQETEHE